MFENKNSFNYKKGYIDGVKYSEKKLSKNLIELIENGFIKNTEDMMDCLNKALNSSNPYIL